MTAVGTEERVFVPRAPRCPIGELIDQDSPVVPCDDLVAALRDLGEWGAIDPSRAATFIECEVGHDGITRRLSQDIAPALAIAWFTVKREAAEYWERKRREGRGEERSEPSPSERPSESPVTYDAVAVADAIALCDELIDRGGPDVAYPSVSDLAAWLHNQHDRRASTEALLALAPIVRRVWDRKQRETEHEDRRTGNGTTDQESA